MDIYLFTNDLDEKKAKLQLIEELNEDEEGQVDDLHSIYRGVGESEVAWCLIRLNPDDAIPWDNNSVSIGFIIDFWGKNQ